MSDLLTSVSSKNSFLSKFATVSLAVIAVVNLINFLQNNVWKPTIEVINVDYPKGVANLKINGRDFVLRGDSTYLIASNWGIKFGTTFDVGGNAPYNRIELMKNNMVYKIIA